MFFKSIFWNKDWEYFSFCITKNIDADTFFLYFVNISYFDKKFYDFKIKFSCKILVSFSWFAWLKYLTKLRFKHCNSKTLNLQKKLQNMLKKLRDFKFVIISVLIFKKSINEGETKYCAFYSNSKAEQLFRTQTLIVYLNQSIVRLWQNLKIPGGRLRLEYWFNNRTKH